MMFYGSVAEMAASGNGKKWVSGNGNKAVGANGCKPAQSRNGKKRDLTGKQTLNG
jgi:F420-0:gamma-glutamyl ligase